MESFPTAFSVTFVQTAAGIKHAVLTFLILSSPANCSIL